MKCAVADNRCLLPEAAPLRASRDPATVAAALLRRWFRYRFVRAELFERAAAEHERRNSQ